MSNHQAHNPRTKYTLPFLRSFVSVVLLVFLLPTVIELLLIGAEELACFSPALAQDLSGAAIHIKQNIAGVILVDDKASYFVFISFALLTCSPILLLPIHLAFGIWESLAESLSMARTPYYLIYIPGIILAVPWLLSATGIAPLDIDLLDTSLWSILTWCGLLLVFFRQIGWVLSPLSVLSEAAGLAFDVVVDELLPRLLFNHIYRFFWLIWGPVFSLFYIVEARDYTFGYLEVLTSSIVHYAIAVAGSLSLFISMFYYASKLLKGFRELVAYWMPRF